MFIYFIVSFVLSLVLMPIIIKLCNRYKLYDYQSARKIHSGDISRLGGIGIALSFFISVLCYLFFSSNATFVTFFPIILAGFIIFVLGITDDLHSLSAIIKLLFQLLAASIVVFTDHRFKQIGPWELPTIISYGLTFAWIIGVINAFNLIDGLDGLCGSLSFTTIVTLGILFYLSGNSEYIICFILAASILGFLIFNWPPAKLFMGDSGSQFLGFMIAVFPLFTSNNVFEHNKLLIIVTLAAFPIFDTIAAIWRRIRDKRPIMSPDKSHLHHKLLNFGYTKTSVLYLVVLIQCLLCCIVILSYFLGALKGAMVLLLSLSFITLFFTFIHYTNKAILKKRRAEEQNLTDE